MLIVTTSEFDQWFAGLPQHAQTLIDMRLLNVERDNLGDHKSLGAGLWELRIHSGPGYRIYYAPRGDTLVIILAGGSKRGQQRDIARARVILAREI